MDESVVPVKVPAFAVRVISLLPSNATPLIFFAVANFVAVDAVPASVAVVAVAALPFIFPTIGLVTVKLDNVPTLVKLEPITLDAKLVPAKVSALTAAALIFVST